MDPGRLIIFEIFIDCGRLLALGYKLLEEVTLQSDSRYKLLLFISVILEDRTLQLDAEIHGPETFAWSSRLFLFTFLADVLENIV